MTPEQWQCIRPMLESALDLDPAQRSAFLDSACSDDLMRHEIESLLESHDRAGAEVLGVASVPPDEARFRIPKGKRIGAYKILDEIAVGGMGAVYRATRDDGQYAQDVALKIVRAELGGDFASVRFKNERQILANLDHPNVAKLLDGGVTPEGIPYLVMELIDGITITEYCDRQSLAIPARIEIFRTVCAAVHYAHQRLIVHRDIKPGNILVTAGGVPKLLDFGIAKVLNVDAPQGADLTVAGTLLLTPEYASPEQFSGDEITTATDVYSLGLVLYELLSGHRAVEVAGRSAGEIARTIADRDPQRPSAAVLRRIEDGRGRTTIDPDTIGRQRATTPQRLHRRLRGDLDNIIMKALRKEPEMRYDSVDQLSEDLRRHLHSEPVRARHNSLRYQFVKFLGRHKVAAASVAVVTLVLAAGLVITLRAERIAHANELRAERRFEEVRSLANSLVFEVNDSIRQLPGAVTARKLIVQRAQQYLETLANESTADPALVRELADAYDRLAGIQGDTNEFNVGDTAGALKSFRKATQLRERAVELNPTDPSTLLALAHSYLRLSGPLGQTGDAEGRKNYIDRAVRILEPASEKQPNDYATRFELARAYEQVARTLVADKNYDRSLDYFYKADNIFRELQRVRPDDQGLSEIISFSHKHIGAVLAVQSKLPAALEQYQAARAIDEQLLARNPLSAEHQYNVTFTYNDTGYILARQGNIDSALDYYRKSLAIRSSLAEADPNDARANLGVATTYKYIGHLFVRKRDYAGALDSYRKSLAIREALVKRDPDNTPKRAELAAAETHIGNTYAEMAINGTQSNKQKLCAQALDWYRRASATRLTIVPVEERDTGDAADVVSSSGIQCGASTNEAATPSR